MCSCVNVTIGGYENQVIIPRPAHMVGRKEGTASDTMCIDGCIANEIQQLWSVGIITTGCCCGHNISTPFIGVIDEDIPRMKEMGYVVQHNPCRPGDEDMFWPKSVFNPLSEIEVVSQQPYKDCTYFSFKRKDGAEIVAKWDFIQQVKDHFFGPEWQAIEVYPKRSELVNEANVRHLWVFPPEREISYSTFKSVQKEKQRVQKD